MKKYSSHMLLFLVVNLFTLLVAQVYVYDYLDDIVAKAHDTKLTNIGRDAQEFFRDEPANRWPVLAKSLSYQLGSQVVVINRADTNIDPTIIPLFELGTSKHTLKDNKRFYVYPFIDENNVVMPIAQLESDLEFRDNFYRLTKSQMAQNRQQELINEYVTKILEERLEQ